MRLRDIFVLTKGTKAIIAIAFALSLLILGGALLYYREINRAEDPRIREARLMLSRFNTIKTADLSSFFLLDSAMAIFRQYPDYANSFEPGIIHNNKASVLLTMAMYDSTLAEAEKMNMLNMAIQYCDSSIKLYQDWISKWGALNELEIQERIRVHMHPDDTVFRKAGFERVIKQRMKDIRLAQIETPRRLSVSLTNKGTAYRHMHLPDSAMLCFEEALRLWKHNHTAKSNLQVLMGGQPEKPNLIRSLFPPDRKKN